MIVQRANVILRIDDDSAQKYLNLGYNVIDEKGKVLQEAIPSDVGTLRKCYVEHLNKIAELEAKLAGLENTTKETKSKKA